MTPYPPAQAAAAAPSPAKVAETGAALRDLWLGHAFWVRNVVLETLAGNKPAAKAADQAKQSAATKSLNANADEIAVFLSGANPNLPRDAVRSLIVAHGAHHVQQIQQLHAGQYTQEAQTWEAMKKHMYVIADTLAGAIARQFPAKFS